MKRLKISALLIVLGTSLALAQGPRGDRMKHSIEHLDSIVDLTDDQKVQLNTLQEAMKVEMKEARSNKDREAMKQLRDKHKADVEAILTDEQLTKLKASREAHREDMKQMRSEIKQYKNEHIKPTLELKRAAFDELLTAEEKATIAALRAEIKTTRGEKGDSAHKKMTPEQRKEMKEKLDASLAPIVSAHKSDLEKIDADLQPLKETWEADIKAIKQEHKGDRNGAKKHECKEECDGKKCSKRKGKKETHKEDIGTMKYYKFLLMKFE